MKTRALIALLALLMASCGGGDYGPDDPDRTTQPVDCKATPELCK